MGGSYHSWSQVFPDAGGLLINTCDLVFPGFGNIEGGIVDRLTWTRARMNLNEASQLKYVH